MAIVFASCLFLVVAFGGLILLRKQRAVGTRALVFLLFAIACVLMTSWITRRWQLLMGEAAVAWVIALLLLGGIEAVTGVIRMRKTPSRQ
jgi:hypothetical protein